MFLLHPKPLFLSCEIIGHQMVLKLPFPDAQGGFLKEFWIEMMDKFLASLYEMILNSIFGISIHCQVIFDAEKLLKVIYPGEFHFGFILVC